MKCDCPPALCYSPADCPRPIGKQVHTPDEGQTVYLGPDRDHPMRVVRVEDGIVWMVPLDTAVRSTHQGNVYNAAGEREWRVW